MTALGILLLLLWFGTELGFQDLARPKPADPFRLQRWKQGDLPPED